LLRFRRVLVADAGLFGGALDQAGEFLEDVGRSDAVGVQDQLALQVAYLVAAASVSVDGAILLGQPGLQHRFFGVDCHTYSLPLPYRALAGLSSRRWRADLAEGFDLAVVVADVIAVGEAPRHAAPEILEQLVVGAFLAG